MANEDYFTSSVDGAAGFERMRSGRESKYPDGYSPDAEYKSDLDDDDDEVHDNCPRCGQVWKDREYYLQECYSCGYPEEDHEDECNCSDPGCPCGGVKHGSL
jgi:ribosomal protein L37E